MSTSEHSEVAMSLQSGLARYGIDTDRCEGVDDFGVLPIWKLQMINSHTKTKYRDFKKDYLPPIGRWNVSGRGYRPAHGRRHHISSPDTFAPLASQTNQQAPLVKESTPVVKESDF